eukprot:GHVR01093079.1.p1 GENE.GHVR01093079.1~~GHVR01093079.1.p1  ORF type:complete len:194 (+),score=38.84 GHVR01093079.1:323-904(+)
MQYIYDYTYKKILHICNIFHILQVVENAVRATAGGSVDVFVVVKHLFPRRSFTRTVKSASHKSRRGSIFTRVKKPHMTDSEEDERGMTKRDLIPPQFKSPPQTLLHILDPSALRLRFGHGLRLVVASKLATALGTQAGLEVVSQQGKGSTMSFTLRFPGSNSLTDLHPNMAQIRDSLHDTQVIHTHVHIHIHI